MGVYLFKMVSNNGKKTMEKKDTGTGGNSPKGCWTSNGSWVKLALRPGQVVVDAGCGSGYMSKLFSKKVGPRGKVFALDPNSHFIGVLEAETRGTPIETIEGDITRSTPIDPSSVDLIYTSTVIHGFSKPQMQGFLKEVQRLLKPRGILAIVEIEKIETSFGPPLNIRFSPEELKAIVPLAPVATIPVAEYFYLQTFAHTPGTEAMPRP